jgi:para-aminobenzoate synthetase/4-amino-4-deoxychorismate lyase
MEASAAYFGFNFKRDAILAALQQEEKLFTAGARTKVRVLLDRCGAISVTHAPIVEQLASGRVAVSEFRVSSGDRFLRHKTTRRRFFDLQYEEALQRGEDDVLFLNERGEITESARSNVFIEKDGQWLTPPVSCGLLPGTFRRHLLETRPEATKKILHLEDLDSADAVYICNSVRGCRKVTVLSASYF